MTITVAATLNFDFVPLYLLDGMPRICEKIMSLCVELVLIQKYRMIKVGGCRQNATIYDNFLALLSNSFSVKPDHLLN